MNTHQILYPRPIIPLVQLTKKDCSSVSSTQSNESYFTDIERAQNPMIKNFTDHQEDDLDSFFDQLE